MPQSLHRPGVWLAVAFVDILTYIFYIITFKGYANCFTIKLQLMGMEFKHLILRTAWVFGFSWV